MLFTLTGSCLGVHSGFWFRHHICTFCFVWHTQSSAFCPAQELKWRHFVVDTYGLCHLTAMKVRHFTPYFCNLGQKVRDNFTKLSKIGFSMECFTADVLQFFTKKSQNLAFGWTTGNSPSDPSISGIFLKFPNFLKS